MVPKIAASLAAAGILLASMGIASSQQYPSRPIELIVGFGPGTVSDLIARRIGAQASETLGQQIVIVNKPGAGGEIAAELVSNAAPDGYTIFYGSSQTHAINAVLRADLPYDPIKDFAPVGLLNSQPMFLVTSTDAETFQELVEMVRSRPGEMNYASTGIGGTPHMVGEYFRKLADLDIEHAPYDSGASMTTDLLAGNTSYIFYPYGPLSSQIEAGKLRAVATTSLERTDWAPDVPTMKELGFEQLDITAWGGLYAPGGVSAEVVAKLNTAFSEAIANEGVRKSLLESGILAVSSTPEEFGAFTAAEIDRYRTLIEATGIRLE